MAANHDAKDDDAAFASLVTDAEVDETAALITGATADAVEAYADWLVPLRNSPASDPQSREAIENWLRFPADVPGTGAFVDATTLTNVTHLLSWARAQAT